MSRNWIVPAGLTVFLGSTSPLVAQDVVEEPAGVKVGVLSCEIEGGWGYVLDSSRDLICSYEPDNGLPERYVGDITRLGVDIGYTAGGTLVQGVVAPTSELEPGALEGDYGGVTAGASLGVGLGANAMIGGFDQSIALQPVSLEGTAGVNLAAGVGAVRLSHLLS